MKVVIVNSTNMRPLENCTELPVFSIRIIVNFLMQCYCQLLEATSVADKMTLKCNKEFKIAAKCRTFYLK